MTLDKSALKNKRLKHTVKEWFEPSIRDLENSDYGAARFVALLRKKDVQARNLMLGKEGKYIGKSVKSMIDEAEKQLRQRDYVNAAGSLTKFYFTLNEVKSAFAELDKVLVQDENKTMTGHIDPETMEAMLEYLQTQKKADTKFSIQKQATVFDWFKDRFDERRRSMKFLENKFPHISQFKKSLEVQIAKARSLLESLAFSFDTLSKARGDNDYNLYHKGVTELGKAIDANKASYDVFFSNSAAPYILWYRDNIRQTPEQKMPEEEIPVEEMPIEEAPAKITEPAIQEDVALEKPEGGWYGASPSPWGQIRSVPEPAAVSRSEPPSNVVPISQEEKSSKPGAKPAEKTKTFKGRAIPEAPKREDKGPSEVGSVSTTGQPKPLRPPGQAVRAYHHEQFITKIAEMDEEDMESIGQAIMNYSHELREQDPIASMKLLAVAESLL